MKNLKRIGVLALVLIFKQSIGQSLYWDTITDNEAGVEFLLPGNVMQYDTLYTTLYGAEIDSTEAVQVHLFRNAVFPNPNEGTAPLFNEALILENNDTLRAIARLILFVTESELTELQEVQTNGVSGLEIGIIYNAEQPETSYHTFIRYYVKEQNFIAFSWTGTAVSMEDNTKEIFFNSIKFE